MGDMSELRGLVTAGTFITVSIILVGLIPTQFYVSTEENRQITTQEYWEVMDIMNFNSTWEDTLYGSYVGYSTGLVDLGGYTFEQSWLSNTTTHISRWDKTSIVWWRYMGDGVFYHGNTELGTRLTSTRLNSDYASGGLDELEYTVEFDATQMKHYYAFNETLYSSPGVAWGNDALYVLWAMDFEPTQSGLDAWGLISMLLFFNLPSIHWTINLILRVPFYICMLYISVILLLRVIGAVFGGGA